MKQDTLFVWNYWYSALPQEIFLDLDSNRAIARALSVLRVAIRAKDLLIESVWLYPTHTANHAHMIIVLKYSMPVPTKAAWALWLGNDRLRTAYVLERYERRTYHQDLLVTRNKYYREYDALCLCPSVKHKESSVTDSCDGMAYLLGDERSADYFTRTGKAPPRRRIRVPWGRVNLSKLKNWSPTYERDERLLSNNGIVKRVRRNPGSLDEGGISTTDSDGGSIVAG
jgi:hypothetical protein